MNTVLEPAARSRSQVLHGLRMTVSASRLNTFTQCRLKFFFRYVEEIQKPKTPALHVGSVIHTTLKVWNKARWRKEPLTLIQLHQEFAKAWVDQDEDPVEWDDDESDQMATAWRLLETYIREGPIVVADQPDAVEVPVEADLGNGLPKLVGVLDLVQSRVIVDFKTTSQTPNPATVGHIHEIQATCYSILYREATGRTEQGIEFHSLVKLKAPKVVVTALPPATEQQEARLIRVIHSYQHGLDVRDWVPSPGMTCLSCEFFNECRNWCGE
jgi:CRISPR/Cas system-associated exonuclease Cas4 (RecB family)